MMELALEIYGERAFEIEGIVIALQDEGMSGAFKE